MTESFKWFYIVILFSAPNSNTRRYLIIGSGLGIRTPNSCSMNALKKDCCLGIYQCHAYKRVIPFHQSAIYGRGTRIRTSIHSFGDCSPAVRRFPYIFISFFILHIYYNIFFYKNQIELYGGNSI